MASLIDLVSPIITPLYNLTLRHAVYLFTAGKNVEDLTEATKRLSAKSEDVQTQIDNANRQGFSAIELQRWLDEVHTIQSKEEVTRGKYDHRYKIFGCCSFNCWSNYKISKGAAKMLLQVKDYLSSTPSVVQGQEVPPPPVQEMHCPSTEQQPTRDVNLQNALQYIKNDLVGMIGIWGLGGVGKTVLLKNINNSFRGDSYFDHVIFVTASKECSVRKVQDEIIQKLRLKKDDHVESQARIISDFLQNRSFMILLDDLWEHIDLQEVGIPYPLGNANQLKRKVVLTTRLLDVCRQMQVSEKIKVDCLPEDEAWQLFQEKVSQETLSSSPRIEYLARQLLKELKGLPLAVITTGRAMNGKSEPGEWELAIHHMQNSCCDDDPLSMESVYRRLMFSYDSLRNDTLRQCFLTCSLWPEDMEIHKDELVQFWMGLGLVDKYDNIQISCKKLYSLIGDLKAACLLESCGEWGNFVKMHDVVRDMAIWISCDRGQNKDKWVVRAGVGTELSANTIPWSKADYVSLMYNQMNELPPFGLSLCSTQLRTLCLRHNKLDERIAGTIKNFTALTYLDLRWNHLKIIPDELCALVNLEYLDLSWNSIEEVPSCFGNLIKLKFLYIWSNNIRTIPKEVISSLKALQVLNWRDRRWGKRKHVVNYAPSLIQELGTLPNFKALDINLDGASEYELLGEAHIPVRELTLSGVEEAPEFCLSGSPFSNDLVRRSLYVLDIVESSMEEITLVRREGCEPNYRFDYLDSLRFIDLQSLRVITWKGISPQDLFPSLTRLCVACCFELEHVSLAMYLPWLEQLEVIYCPNIKQAFPSIENYGVKMCSGQGSSMTSTDAFPCLKILSLHGLDLVSICNSDVTFRSLEYLQVQSCENLKGLPFRMQSLPLKLKELRICAELWEKLEMEEGVKSKLQPFLRFTPKEIIIRMQPDSDKSHQALKVAATVSGVESVTVTGRDKDLLLVIGNDVDTSKLTKKLRKEVGEAEIVELRTLDAGSVKNLVNFRHILIQKFSI